MAGAPRSRGLAPLVRLPCIPHFDAKRIESLPPVKARRQRRMR